MIPATDRYRGRHLAILGMGTSGMAAARLARRLGADVTLLDDGAADRLAPALAAAAREDFRVLAGSKAISCEDTFDLAVLSPGIDPSWPLARSVSRRGIPCLGEVEFAFQQSRIPVIAVTGTNGKTTTTGLIAHLLGEAGVGTVPCGNYGTALSEVVLGGEPLDVLTVEVSSFQLELTETFRPAVAVWMNFAPDHLDRHPDLAAYLAAKRRIFENQEPSDTAVINGAETHPAIVAGRVTFSAWQEDCDWTFRDGFILQGGEPVLALTDTRLRGRHNAENIMAALAAVTAWGVPLRTAAAAVPGFTPPRHRCEVAASVGGREFLNDSKATNIHAMESALRGQDRPVVLIAGGKDKGLDYAPVLPLIREKTTQVFTIGEIASARAGVWPGAVSCQDL